jgi:hypothetical protein
MSLPSDQFVWSIIIAVLLAGSLAYLLWKQRKEAKLTEKNTKSIEKNTKLATAPVNTKQLQLQAYERLILLTDRIGLPNLINRVNQQGMNVKEMQVLLTQSIKQEFEHNITQQIYVTPEAWDAVRNLKEQNLLIINQVASYLPAEASGNDLNRSLLELIMNNPNTSMQNLVADALSFEAKKLM